MQTNANLKNFFGTLRYLISKYEVMKNVILKYIIVKDKINKSIY